MRSSKSRSRSKSNRPRSMGNIINRVFDSSGPEGKVRGTPQQIIEKYLILARDAQLSNDRVAAENFLQHAEHYTRLLGEAQRELTAEQEARQQQYQSGQNNGPNAGQNPGQNHGQGGGQNYRERGNDPRGDQRDNRDMARDNGRNDIGRNERIDDPGAGEQPDLAAEVSFPAAEDHGNLVETPESQPRRENEGRARNERRPPRQQQERRAPRGEGQGEIRPPRKSVARADESAPEAGASAETAPVPADAPNPGFGGEQPAFFTAEPAVEPAVQPVPAPAADAAPADEAAAAPTPRAPRRRAAPRRPRATEAAGGDPAPDTPEAAE